MLKESGVKSETLSSCSTVAFLREPSDSQAAERRVHDPTLFVPLIMVANGHQTISEESESRTGTAFI